MSVVEAYPLADPSVLQILRQLCRALNPVKVLRRNRASTPHSPNVTRASGRRRGLQNSIEVLNVAFSIAETIPVVGPPLKGALEALCKVLGQVEVSGAGRLWNAAHWHARIAEVTERGGGCEAYREAGRPRRNLSMVESPDLILVELTKRLYTVRDELDTLMYSPGVHYAAIAQALAGFTGEIDSCLLDYIAVVQIRLEERTRVMDAERLATQCVRVLDPFGHQQLILRVDVQNAGIVATVILSRYTRNPKWHQALDQFVRGGLYELSMDDGNQIQSLTACLGSTVNHHGTVVMNVVLLKVLKERDKLRCPICNGPMPVSEEDRREVCTTCNRRVSALKSNDPSADAVKHVQHTDSIENLFRNILIRHRSDSSIQGDPTAGGVHNTEVDYLRMNALRNLRTRRRDGMAYKSMVNNGPVFKGNIIF